LIAKKNANLLLRYKTISQIWRRLKVHETQIYFKKSNFCLLETKWSKIRFNAHSFNSL